MKKSLALALILAVAVTGMAFGQVKAKDGTYFAQDSGFAPQGGWRDQVVVTVKGGKIVALTWNGTSNLPGAGDKDSYAAAGKYGMKQASKLGTEWDQQAKAVTDYVLKTQNAGFNKFKADGTTDAISGASIHVQDFFVLLNKALSSPAVPKGIYAKDGWYYAEQADFDKNSGWKDTVLITVANGSIVDVLWNGIYKDNTKKSKLVEAVEGRYGMAKAAKNGEWNVQAKAVQDYIIKVQDPAKIAVKADGTTDAISGASIHVSAIGLAIQALKAAR
jgi:major membrane immunogen (membrane-anchored lipoprotein)